MASREAISLPVRSKPAKRKKTATPLLEAGGGSRVTSREGSEEAEETVAVGPGPAADLIDEALRADENASLLGRSSTPVSRWATHGISALRSTGRRRSHIRGTGRLLLVSLACLALLVVIVLYTGIASRRSGLDLPVLSNGTHPYTPITILLSLDGFRSSYLEAHASDLLHLMSLIDSPLGIRAESMQPVFPSLTFPNHWALMTGLLPVWSGIIANDFWDPERKKEFYYTDESRSWDSGWWLGEPMWSVVDRNGGKAANIMWPGPPTTSAGVSPSYFVPFRDMQMRSKVDQVLSWLDLPIKERPDLITAYVPEIDAAGHLDGADSPGVREALGVADAGVGQLLRGLEERNLSEIVNLLVVSDHGMTATSDDRLIFLDDIIGAQGMQDIEHRDGWPLAGLRIKEGSNETHYLDMLSDAADKSGGSFAVYTPETMPAQWHFSGSERIAPVYLVPALGWSITDHHELDVLMGGKYKPKGNHGYDNTADDMQAIFLAHGPVSKRLSSWTASETPSLSSFRNVEVFSLVMTILGLENVQPPHNGTVGYWHFT